MTKKEIDYLSKSLKGVKVKPCRALNLSADTLKFLIFVDRHIEYINSKRKVRRKSDK